MNPYRSDRVTLNNGETCAYLTAGHGDQTVFFLHGNLSSSLHSLPFIEALGHEYTLIAPDLRGFGDSSYLTPFSSLKELARDIDALADILHIQKCHVIGWSAGGGVAMEWAAMNPGRVKSLILTAAVPPMGYPMYQKDAAGQPEFSSPITTREEVARDPVQVLPALRALESGDRAFMRYLWDLTIYTRHKPPNDTYELYLDGIMKQRCLIDMDYALLSFNITDQKTPAAEGSNRIRAIRCPVTLLHGEQDRVVPLAWGQETACLFGALAKPVVFPEAGHAPMTDVPDAYFAAVREAFINAG